MFHKLLKCLIEQHNIPDTDQHCDHQFNEVFPELVWLRLTEDTERDCPTPKPGGENGLFFKISSLQITAANPNAQSTANSAMLLLIGSQLIKSVAVNPQRHPIKKDTDVFMPDLTGPPVTKYIPAQAKETHPNVIPKDALTTAQIGGSKATPNAVGSMSNTLLFICECPHNLYQLSRCSLYISGKIAARFVNSFTLWLNRARGPASGHFTPWGKTRTSFSF